METIIDSEIKEETINGSVIIYRFKLVKCSDGNWLAGYYIDGFEENFPYGLMGEKGPNLEEVVLSLREKMNLRK